MYVDAYFKKNGSEEVIRVVERVQGKRVYKEYTPDYHFYVNDPRGSHKSIYGDPVKMMVPRTFAEKQKLLKSLSGNVKKWESDVDPVFRALEQHYQNIDAPSLHVAFFDIETSFDPELGWSEPADATNAITSISVHLQWIDEILCLAVPPETLTMEEAQVIANEVGNVILFKTEGEMLQMFMDVIEDADVLSGWNSEVYDIPYTINRIKKVLGKHEARKMCLWEQEPKIREFERGGKTQPTYDLIGRIHVDYLQLYKKYNYEERHSYSLNAIAEIELGETKVEYEGTLDELYNDDFKKFLQYNIQDTRLIDKLDKILSYIDLANSIAHANCVLVQTTMGAVAVTDQAVLMEAHHHGKVVPDKKHTREGSGEDNRAAGGWVATPRKGFHRYIGSTDMKSLYPSVIRAFNMSPETIVGQIRLDRTNTEIALWERKGGTKHTFAAWWNDRFNVLEMDDFYNQDIGTPLTLDMEDGSEYTITGKELHELIFESGQPWCISANGTIFRSDIDGIIPSLLTRWYKERKILQARAEFFNLVLAGYELKTQVNDIVTPEHDSIDPIKVRTFTGEILTKILELDDPVQRRDNLADYGLDIVDGKALPKEKFVRIWKDVQKYYDKLQLVKKISLNSAYGALLNAGSRFFDQRLGQSTTLSGRSITRHMAARTNEMITGNYDHYGDAIIYGDTDSCYFSAYPILKKEIENGEIEWTKESVIDLYNNLAKEVSATFPGFLKGKFHVPESRSTGVIASSRETVSETGIWIVKKRYACLMYDKDGIRQDTNGKPGKVKAMGLDLKRADTPKMVQKFLSEILLDTLCDKGDDYVIEKIRNFKEVFENMKPWQQGTPRAVNRLSFYREKEELHAIKKAKGEATGAITIPGHVKASLMWNRMKEVHRDNHSMRIIDGQKVIVCKLKQTPNNTMTSIAFPIDESHLPEWFVELPFDSDDMMAAIVDKKIENLLGVLNWPLERANSSFKHLNTLFDFSKI